MAAGKTLDREGRSCSKPGADDGKSSVGIVREEPAPNLRESSVKMLKPEGQSYLNSKYFSSDASPTSLSTWKSPLEVGLEVQLLEKLTWSAILGFVHKNGIVP